MMGKDNLNAVLRPYQLEMFEKSMEKNIIVAMETGSGKTHIAFQRILSELDRSYPEKFIWFLAPTVELVKQQQRNFQKFSPAIQSRTLLGEDEVDKWSNKILWEAALNNVAVVFSTYQVLYDALVHAFVKMQLLSLIVFDEAHHCNKKHPSNMIMQEFYHRIREKEGLMSVPHILGLTASPTVNAKENQLKKVESNLNAISITPKIHKLELEKFVNAPLATLLIYQNIRCDSKPISLLQLKMLHSSCESKYSNIHVTLYQYTHDEAIHLKFVNQLTLFYQRAEQIYEDLGPWACDYFIHETKASLRNKIVVNNDSIYHWKDSLKHLSKFLDQNVTNDRYEPMIISPKVQKVIEYLKQRESQTFRGIIFVQRRVTVSLLSKIFSKHVDTRSSFPNGTFVGKNQRQYNLDELLDIKQQDQTLSGFRDGNIKLIIATDVLEEGIDVSACNFVISFDSHKTFRAFIQRRGRARHQKSEYTTLIEEKEEEQISKLLQAERDMTQIYQDESRFIDGDARLEVEDEVVDYKLLIESTGAFLNADAAVSHLSSFVQSLQKVEGIENIVIYKEQKEEYLELFKCEIFLPSVITPSLQQFQSQKKWKTKSAARKDAAFHAYKALHEAGLVNDHLLPISHTLQAEEAKIAQSIRPGKITSLPSRKSFFHEVGKEWETPRLHQIKITATSIIDQVNVIMLTPVAVSIPSALMFHLSQDRTYQLEYSACTPCAPISHSKLETYQKITQYIHNSTDRSSFGTLPRDDDCIFLFIPQEAFENPNEWYETYCKCTSFQGSFTTNNNDSIGIIRNKKSPWELYEFQSFDAEHTENPKVRCIPLRKRRNLLHALLPIDSDEKETSRDRILELQDCSMNHLHRKYSCFNLLLPSMLRCFELNHFAQKLSNEVLKEPKIKNTSHIVTSLCTGSSGWLTNYERYEFLGDTVLKFVVSLTLLNANPHWLEGHLSQRKGFLVSNIYLANVAKQLQLSKYIISDTPKHKGWKAPKISTTKEEKEVDQIISTKTLADVVEALVGAYYIDQGFEASKQFIATFIPEVQESFGVPQSPTYTEKLDNLIALEQLIGYSFQNRSLLLQAITHPSSIGSVNSYQRLEFLGDAVLDLILGKHIFDQHNLAPSAMTILRHSLVNNFFLGFLCMEYSTTQPGLSTIHNTGTPRTPNFRTAPAAAHRTALWQFLRHSSASLAQSSETALARYAQLRETIREGLASDLFPWAALAQLAPDKFFADMVEAVLGAIFLDNGGELDACSAFVRRLGLVGFVDAFVRRGCALLHPKSVLQNAVAKDGLGALVRYETIMDKLGTYTCTVFRVQTGKLKRDSVQSLEVVEHFGNVENVENVKNIENIENVKRFEEVELLTSVDGCLRKDSAELLAADKAYRLLTKKGECDSVFEKLKRSS